MEKSERTVSELSTLFRMIQVISDADNIGRIYQMLLAFCTTWKTIGFDRAFLLQHDGREEALRGHIAAERVPLPVDAVESSEAGISFEELAKSVFENYEQIESSELTLRTRTFSVGLDWTRSAVVKAATSGHPVLAEDQMSEFSTDPFFEFFETNRYIAVPIRVGNRVLGVVAADNAPTGRPVTVEDVSLVHSLAQQAGIAVGRLSDAADNRRKFRIVRKIQDIMRSANTDDEINEGFKLALSMICRAVGGTGCFIKDFVRNRTLHIKTVDEYTVDAGSSDMAVGESFEKILDRCAGSMRPVRGDGQHPLLNDESAAIIRFFYAYPLVVVGGGLGAIAVYMERDSASPRMGVKDRTFLELCAGIIGDRLNTLHKTQRTERVEEMIEEIRFNLVRERDSSRFGERALEFYSDLTRGLARLRKVIFSRLPYEKRIERAKELFEQIDREKDAHENQLAAMKSQLRMLDLFGIVDEIVRHWAPALSNRGVDITTRIPRHGPTLLANHESIRTAVRNVLETLARGVGEGDRVLIECTASDEKATICIADTGDGLPGHLLSRLFMPFTEPEDQDSEHTAMSVAGDILQHHGGEVSVKSSPSWKTILVISLPMAANRDRRDSPRDRRRRRDRRAETADA